MMLSVETSPPRRYADSASELEPLPEMHSARGNGCLRSYRAADHAPGAALVGDGVGAGARAACLLGVADRRELRARRARTIERRRGLRSDRADYRRAGRSELGGDR